MSLEHAFPPQLDTARKTRQLPKLVLLPAACETGDAADSVCPDRLRRFGHGLDSFQGAEHVTSVAALPQESTQWGPDLGEEVVSEVE